MSHMGPGPGKPDSISCFCFIYFVPNVALPLCVYLFLFYIFVPNLYIFMVSFYCSVRSWIVLRSESSAIIIGLDTSRKSKINFTSI